jgi:hypothetical protein
MQNTQELFTLKKKKKKNTKHKTKILLTIHLEILLTNTNLTFEIVLLMFFCTSHVAPKKKNYTYVTKHKIQDQTLVTTNFGGHMSLIRYCFSMFGSIPHPASHALFQPKTRLKP